MMMRGSSFVRPVSRGNCARKNSINARVRGRPLDRSRPNLEKKHQQVKDFRILEGGKFRMFRFALLFILDEFRKGGVESCRNAALAAVFRSRSRR